MRDLRFLLQKTSEQSAIIRLICLATMIVASAFDPMHAVGQDFVYNGIGYRVDDEQAKICKTRAHCRSYGSMDVDNGSVVIPDTVYNEDNVAFTVKYIVPDSFSGDEDLVDVKLPDNLEQIGSYAFSGCKSLVSINTPDFVRYIFDGAFKNCTSLKSITLPDGIKWLEYELFYGCSSLESIEIPNSVIGIESAYCYEAEPWSHGIGTIYSIDGVFEGCTSLRNIRLPDNMSVIGACAFANCSNLETVTLPKALHMIGTAAFAKCESLKEIICPVSGVWHVESPVFEFSEMEIISEYGSDPFSQHTYDTATLKVGIGELEDARIWDTWKKFKHIEEVDFSGVEGIKSDPSDGRTVVYRMDGSWVGDSPEGLPSGLYIVRKGGSTNKVMVP